MCINDSCNNSENIGAHCKHLTHSTLVLRAKNAYETLLYYETKEAFTGLYGLSFLLQVLIPCKRIIASSSFGRFISSYMSNSMRFRKKHVQPVFIGKRIGRTESGRGSGGTGTDGQQLFAAKSTSSYRKGIFLGQQEHIAKALFLKGFFNIWKLL